MAAKRAALASRRQSREGDGRGRFRVSPDRPTPMRARPKSKARTGCSPCRRARRRPESFMKSMPSSCMARRGALPGQIEDDGQIGGHGEPGVLGELVFKLAGGPASVAEGDQHLAGLPSLARDRSTSRELVRPTGVAHLEGRMPVAGRAMEHEAAIRLQPGRRNTPADRQNQAARRGCRCARRAWPGGMSVGRLTMTPDGAVLAMLGDVGEVREKFGSAMAAWRSGK